MEVSTLADRLKWARERHGRFKGPGGPTEAARAFGWAVSTYLGHENGDRAGARLSTIKKYAKAYKVRWEWLLDGSGSPTDDTGGPLDELEGEYLNDALRYIGRLRDLQALQRRGK